jgi:hypothetical protein
VKITIKVQQIELVDAVEYFPNFMLVLIGYTLNLAKSIFKIKKRKNEEKFKNGLVLIPKIK